MQNIQRALKIQQWVILAIALAVIWSCFGIHISQDPVTHEKHTQIFLKSSPTVKLIYLD